jgi:CarD family transcriptional regulator
LWRPPGRSRVFRNAVSYALLCPPVKRVPEARKGRFPRIYRAQDPFPCQSYALSVINWSAGKGKVHMVFEVGETVVYPHHGAAKIEEIKMRTIKGEEKMYLKLKVAQGDLTIEVPAENVDLVGVRDVVGKEGLEHVFDVLRAEFTEEPTNWSRRYKANLEKLASGDVIKVAEVVRDLWRRDHDRGLSAGEKRMLAKARQILISELALAEKTDEEKAASVLDEVLAS